MEPVLDISGLSATIGGRAVLENVSVSVGAGEIVGLLGPNGSGKSTLLGMLTGRWTPPAGTVRVDGIPLETAGRGFRSRLGVVFQQPALDGKLSARQNLRLAAMVHGVPRAVARDREEEALRDADLLDRADEVVESFSGGMRRRLDVARALLPHPRVLLLDEPSTGLDEASFRSLWDRLMPRIRERGLAVLVATHRPDEAERCDRLVLLHGGRLIREATPQALMENLGDDMIELRGRDLEALAARVRDELSLDASAVGERVQVLCTDGPRRLPEVLGIFASGEVSEATLRRPGLSDAFARLTGASLAGEVVEQGGMR